MYRKIRFLLWLLCCLLGMCRTALAADVQIIYSERGQTFADAGVAIQNALTRLGMSRTDAIVISLNEWQRQKQAGFSPAKVWIAVGSDALASTVAESKRPPVLGALVPRLAYERIVSESSNKSGVSGIYLDQPVGRILQVAKAAWPDVKRVGMLLGPETLPLVSSLKTSSQEAGLQLSFAPVDNPSQILPALQSVLGNAQVLVALADPAVYNPTTVGNILLGSYKAHVPLLAFSPSYVKAGALLGVYTSLDGMAGQMAKMVRSTIADHALPAPVYPQEFVVEVNEYVARSMGYELNSSHIEDKVRRAEGAKP